MEHAERSELPPERLKPISAVLDTVPVLAAQVLDLVRWASDYYHHPIGEVIASALPKALRAGASSLALEELWRPTPQGRAALAAGQLARAPAQRQLLEWLQRRRTAAPGAAGAAAAALARGRERAAQTRLGGGETVAASVPYSRPASAPAPAAPDLTVEQAQAIATIGAALHGFAAFVLHGLTGSGKTEVYLQVIQQVLARRPARTGAGSGNRPDTRSWCSVSPNASNTPMAVLHSGLSDGERLTAWRAAASGAARIVVGTRSAVFAPLPDLGVIIVDEEHDASLKQHEGGFHYSARDLALVRAQRAQVAGGARLGDPVAGNPAERRKRALSASARCHAAPDRPRRRAWRSSTCVPTPSAPGLATPVVQAIERHLAAAGQVLVFLNRRGYAPTLLCTACGWVAPCRDCDARLTVHQRSGRLRCHHCGADAPLPKSCPQCGFELRPVGQGTERVEERLRELFPARAAGAGGPRRGARPGRPGRRHAQHQQRRGAHPGRHPDDHQGS